VHADDDAARAARRDRALVRAAGSALVARAVTSVSAVLSLAVAAGNLTQPQLGVVSVLAALVIVVGFGDFGLGNLLMTRLPAARAVDDVDAQRHIVATTLSILCGAGALMVLLGVGTCWWVPWQSLLGAEDLSRGSVLACVAAFFVLVGLAVPGSLGGRVLAALQRSSTLYAWTAVAAVAGLVATAACAVTDAPLWAYLAAVVGAPAVFGVAQTLWVLEQHPELRPTSLRVEPAEAVRYLRAGSLFAALSLTVVINYYVDSLVVASVEGAAAGAVFAIAARMFALVGGTVTLAGQQLWSALAEAVARGDVAWVRSRYHRALVVSTALNAVGCFGLALVGRTVTRLWVGQEYVPPYSLLWVLAGWTVVSTAVVQASYLLAAVERLRVIALTSVLMVPLNLALSVALTHQVGLTGPLLGSLAALLLVQLVPLVVCTTRLLRELEAGGAGPRRARR
jgi:O-antigen/teichoic acid export membrane protein